MNRQVYSPVFYELARHVEASGGSVLAVDDNSITLEYPDEDFAAAVESRVKIATTFAEAVLHTRLGTIERAGRVITCRKVH